MNRRDIIIVAVLINVGLLVTLFVSSLKKEETLAEVATAPEKVHKTEVITPVVFSKEGKDQRDQIDQVISQYTAMAQAEEKIEVKEVGKKEGETLSFPVLTPTLKTEMQASSSNPLRVVTVGKGDALEKIARSYGISVDEIMKLNNLSNSRLQIGQELKLPEKKSPRKEVSTKDGEGKFYVVKGGDNPWTIAQKNGIQVEELLRLNSMDEEKAKRLRPGDRLKIR